MTFTKKIIYDLRKVNFVIIDKYGYESERWTNIFYTSVISNFTKILLLWAYDRPIYEKVHL
jgi:hypothetical protein